MSTKLKIFTGVIIVVVLVALGCWKYCPLTTQEINQEQQPTNTQSEDIKNTFSFTCKDGKAINAIFKNEKNNSVDIILSDGRSFSLPQAISASGARYANSDESIVFWTKGNGAFLLENDAQTFSDCITTQ